MLSLQNKDIISVRDLKKEEIEIILEKTKEMEEVVNGGKVLDTMKGKVLATLFFEPSTRTRLSFSTAMQRLGGSVIGFEGTQETSLAKGENFTDTIRVVEKYCDVIVIRHPKEGAARFAAEISSKPVINAGDGANQHPTQALLDLYTIKKLKGNIENLNITLFGDLKYGRVMKSIVYILAMFGANLTLVSPPGLEMSSEIVEEIKENFNAKIFQTNDPFSGIKKADILYVCRIQKERFPDPYEAEKIQKTFRITQEMLKEAKEDMIILHPLPKVTEIEYSIDNTKYAKYFDQVFYGVPVRMAILSLVCG
ncbi:MAG: aspartate carbamoyltransferase [Candidatus Aenigmatarchaeota archaeon]